MSNYVLGVGLGMIVVMLGVIAYGMGRTYQLFRAYFCDMENITDAGLRRIKEAIKERNR